MRDNKYRVFVINPGSTSTKVALFEDDINIFEESVSHDASVLNSFDNVNDQLGYRLEVVNKLIEDNKLDMKDLDAIVGRGGGCSYSSVNPSTRNRPHDV